MYRQIRQLNADDLLILHYLGQGLSQTEIGKRLFLTQPAISQHMTKISKLTDKPICTITTRKTVLTDHGRMLCQVASETLQRLVIAFPDSLS